MTRLFRFLLLGCLLAGSSATAGDWGLGSARAWSSDGRPPNLTRARQGGATAASQRLEAFSEQRRFEARVRMTHTARDAERRAAEYRLRRNGNPARLASYRRRVVREDDLDDLRLASGLSRIEAAGKRANADLWWASLGPDTRRVFLRNGLALRSTRRAADRRARLDRLERDIERRQPTPADELFGAPARP
jgi:hypothetical protein